MGRRKAKAKLRKRKRKAGAGKRRFEIIAGVLVLLAVAGGVAGWWQLRHWRPDETLWPDQGAIVGEADGAVDFTTLKGLGAEFVYLEASRGAEAQDARFSANLAAARAAGLQVGAMHIFDPCVPADGQSANFVTMVPRDSDLLPPAIVLDSLAEECPARVPDAAVQSELMTLVNQIESHTGKAAILAPTKAFEDAYSIAARLNRQLWLTRSWFEPHYAGRPWLLWTANEGLKTVAADAPLRWVVVRPEGASR